MLIKNSLQLLIGIFCMIEIFVGCSGSIKRSGKRTAAEIAALNTPVFNNGNTNAGTEGSSAMTPTGPKVEFVPLAYSSSKLYFTALTNPIASVVDSNSNNGAVQQLSFHTGGCPANTPLSLTGAGQQVLEGGGQVTISGDQGTLKTVIAPKYTNKVTGQALPESPSVVYFHYISADGYKNLTAHDPAAAEMPNGVGNGSGAGACTQSQVIPAKSPLVLDMGPVGIVTLGLFDGVKFNHSGSAAADTGWVLGGLDPFVVRDRNGDWKITNGNELFGNNTVKKDGSKAANGFEALGEFDSNKDGYVDNREASSAGIKLWFDSNLLGVSEVGELQSFPQGMRIRTADYEQVSEMDKGNETRQRSTYSIAGAKPRLIIDIWFVARD